MSVPQARQPFPGIEPHASGLLDVGDGNRIYWESSGNPRGRPALVVHGGPGSGSLRGACRGFDPDAFRIVLFDQRGCGKSLPDASDPRADMAHNTTEHLLADMESLREQLARAWPDAELRIIEDSGHTGSPAMQTAVLDAIARFAGKELAGSSAARP